MTQRDAKPPALPNTPPPPTPALHSRKANLSLYACTFMSKWPLINTSSSRCKQYTHLYIFEKTIALQNKCVVNGQGPKLELVAQVVLCFTQHFTFYFIISLSTRTAPLELKLLNKDVLGIYIIQQTHCSGCQLISLAYCNAS